MSDHALTTQQVEDGFAHEPEYEYHNPIGYGAHVQGNRRAFRRWLAEVEREAAEKALTDAADELDGYDLSLGSDKRPPDGDWHVDIGYYGEANWLRARAEAYRQERKEG